ncbi:hypothetical protein, partial [Dialister succinatiphilus]|uniref:hypothetical protein n=1 Tax=Dialister succinatiphilus TaxID=487173 RepID=UPI004029FC92
PLLLFLEKFPYRVKFYTKRIVSHFPNMPFFGWRLTENFFLSPLLCQNRVHQNGPSFSSGRRDFSLFFPIKHFSN